MRFGQESGFIVSFLFPGFGRVCWSSAIAFMILATTTQFGNGIKNLKNLNSELTYFKLQVQFQSFGTPKLLF